MPSKPGYVKAILVFSILGFLFAGYLSFTKLVLGSCPLTEGCPYFLGYPACVYGFILYAILLVLAWMMLAEKIKDANKKMRAIFYISLIGIIFSAYNTYKEYVFPQCIGGVCQYSLLLPTCVYGLVMYAIIFVISMRYLKK